MPPILPFIDKGASMVTPSASLPSSQSPNAHIMPSSPVNELATKLDGPAATGPPSSASQHSLTASRPVQTTAINMAPTNPLGLLGTLPRELRDMIYVYAVDPPTKEDFAGGQENYYRDITRRRTIMQTCKHIRLECMESYLWENEVDFVHSSPHLYKGFQSLSGIFARPYFRAQGFSRHISLSEKKTLPALLTATSLQEYNPMLQIYLHLHRTMQRTPFSIPSKNLFTRLDYSIPIYAEDDVSAQWRFISPNGDKIPIKLWVNDREKSVAEVVKVCSRLKDTALRSCQQSTVEDPSGIPTPGLCSLTHVRVQSWRGERVSRISNILALITELEKQHMAVIEAMMLWWQDEDEKDKKDQIAKQKSDIEQRKRKRDHEDEMQRIKAEHQKRLEEMELRHKRSMQEIAGLKETQGRSSKRRRLD